MPTRTGAAQWKGDLKTGGGTVTVAGRTLPYSAPARFEEGSGTNPEELIAAAHAGCFTMALSHDLSTAGFQVNDAKTTAAVRIAKKESGWVIDRIVLTVRADVDEIDEATFVEFAERAKANCPVSKALGAVETITVDAALI